MGHLTVAVTKESQAIRDAIYRYGCVTQDQLEYFMPPTARKRDNYHAVICNHLISAKIAARTDNGVVFPYINNGYSQAMIDAVWVMIDILSDENSEIPLSEKMEVSFKGDHPETLCFIKDSADSVKVIAIETASQIPLLTFAQEKYYASVGRRPGEEIKQRSITIITIRDKSLLNEIGKIGLTIPHKIAYLDGGLLDKPTIKYFGAAPKKQ